MGRFRKVMPVEYRRALNELNARRKQPQQLRAAGE
jgi:glutamate synthase (NADPH/NADH) large chain